MQLVREHIKPDEASSFRCLEYEVSDFDGPHHRHPEIEITHIIAGPGQRLVGDRLSAFEPGDLALLGPNLPHMYRSWESGHVHARVIQFPRELLPSEWLQLPETHGIGQLLESSARGMTFSAESCQAGIEQMGRVFAEPPGTTRLAALLVLLDTLSRDPAPTPIASLGYRSPENAREADRLRRVLNHIEDRWQEKVTLAEVAQVACLHPQSLSRFFQRHLGVSFQAYLIELRLSRAARQLHETDRSIAQIAFDSGFNNLANFNRLFRQHFKCAPREHRNAGPFQPVT